ncbi:unnamed protein product [Bemisia tabaci]|uniref:LysM domain-containing protein n=1 Tax=Bemisia tabaci TaxID=7038 RepID=A0A9P0C4L3_BEMTA|nr:unnamed protein product [Bemisia tabaci]
MQGHEMVSKKSRSTFLPTILMVVAIVSLPAIYAATTYTIVSGDTLWKIAQRNKVTLNTIVDANPQINNPNAIYPGQKITIPDKNTVPSSSPAGSIESQVVTLVNEERAKHGRSPLRELRELSKLARTKSADMRDRGYFDHTSPRLGSASKMMKDAGLKAWASGENIAAGQTTAQTVMNSWMNSQGHRENILSPDFKEIGVGFAKGGSWGYYWTQMFIKR